MDKKILILEERCEEQNNVSRIEIELFKEKVRVLEEHNNESNESLANSNRKITSYEKEIHQLSEDCRELTDINEKNFKLSQALSTKVITLKSKLKSSNQRISNQKQRIKCITSDKVAMEVALDSQDERIHILLSEVQVLEAFTCRLSREKEDIVKHDSELMETKCNLLNEVTELRASNNEFLDVNSVLKNIVSGLKQ